MCMILEFCDVILLTGLITAFRTNMLCYCKLAYIVAEETYCYVACYTVKLISVAHIIRVVLFVIHYTIARSAK